MRSLPIDRLEYYIRTIYEKFEMIYKGEYKIESLEHMQEENPDAILSKDSLRRKYHKFYFDTIL